MTKDKKISTNITPWDLHTKVKLMHKDELAFS